MNPELRQDIKEFFKRGFADKIKSKLLKGHRLSAFKVNPLSLVSLSSGVLGEPTAANMAKALLYPRVLGTSINTVLGDRVQALCTQFLGSSASATPGMDIEFIDKVDGQKVYLQLKSGPNTINSGDVGPIVTEMVTAYRLLQQNRVGEMPLFAVGITYGRITDISSHYKNIQAQGVGGQANIPIYIGQDFWHRVTGSPSFYSDLVSVFVELFEEENYSDLLQEDLSKLAKAIDTKYFTNGKFDISKV